MGVRGQNKFRNKPTTVDGIRFDSKREAKRYQQLKLLERAGEISGLELQPKFTFRAVSGEEIRYPPTKSGARGRVLRYTADFAYIEKGERIIEDVKGGQATQTQAFRIRAALMYSCHGIIIRFT